MHACQWGYWLFYLISRCDGFQENKQTQTHWNSRGLITYLVVSYNIFGYSLCQAKWWQGIHYEGLLCALYFPKRNWSRSGKDVVLLMEGSPA